MNKDEASKMLGVKLEDLVQKEKHTFFFKDKLFTGKGSSFYYKENGHRNYRKKKYEWKYNYSLNIS